MTVGQQMRYWAIGLAVLVALVWLLSEALLPFLLGAAIAYFTDPLADRLERLGLSRLMATVTLTAAILGIAALAVLLLVPALIEQVRYLVENAPRYVEEARAALAAWLPELNEQDGVLAGASGILGQEARDWSVAVVQRLWAGGVALVDFVALVVITPVVAFYLLYDWDNLVARIDDLVPREHLATVRRLALELDDVLAGFVRGQLTVCLVLGTFYAVALTLVGLRFGLLVGLFAGLISFIPFVGSIIGGLLSIGIAIAQFWSEPIWIAIVAGIFVAGQAVEGNYLTPKLVGGHVKLHPVWLMLALSVFGMLMGFVGLLMAVPLAAMIGVLARFSVENYKAGRLYRGYGTPQGGPPVPRPPAPDATGPGVSTTGPAVSTTGPAGDRSATGERATGPADSEAGPGGTRSGSRADAGGDAGADAGGGRR